MSDIVGLIRLSTEGNKSELARALVTERFSHLGEAAISLNYLAAFHRMRNEPSCSGHGGPLFAIVEAHIARTVREARAHFMATRAKDVTRKAKLVAPRARRVCARRLRPLEREGRHRAHAQTGTNRW